MPIFEVKGKDGNIYQVKAESAESAVSQFQSIDKGYKGSFFPYSADAFGNKKLDLSAGITGQIADLVRGRQMNTAGMRREDFTDIPGDAQPSDATIKQGLLTAATFNPAPAAMRAGERAIPGVARSLRPVKPSVPTTTELSSVGRAGYERVFGNPDKNIAGMQVDYAPGAVKNLVDQVDKNLFARGVHPTRAPETYDVIKGLQNPPDGSVVTLANINAVRQTLSDIAFKAEGAEKVAATVALKRLDDFIAQPPAEGVLAGPASEAGKEFATARGNVAASKRSNTITGDLDKAITGVAEKAEDQASRSNSGLNIDNSIRQRTSSLLRNEGDLTGFNEAEIAALNRVVEGDTLRNTARTIGNLGGGGLGAAATMFGGAGLGAGIMTANPAYLASLAIPAAGYGSRKIANALTRRSLNQADELVRMRSPLYEAMAANPQMTPVTPEGRAAVLRALMLASENQQ